MRVASTKLTNPDWEALQNKCNEEGRTIAEHLRNLIHADLNGGKPAAKAESREGEEMTVNETNNADTSALTHLLRRGTSHNAQPKQRESRTEIVQMQELLKKQNLHIQNLMDQLKELVRNADEQGKRQEQGVTQSPHFTGKIDCTLSNRLHRFGACSNSYKW